MECQYIQSISSYDNSINSFSPLSTSGLHFGGGATHFKNFLFFNAPYGGSNGSKNTFPSQYQLPTSCTHYIHFRFAFSGCATQFKKFLFFNAPYGGSNGSNNIFPSRYQLPTSCTRYIHLQFAFLGCATQFKNFLSVVLSDVSSNSVKKYLPLPIPSSYFLYTLHSLPVCVFWGCHPI